MCTGAGIGPDSNRPARSRYLPTMPDDPADPILDALRARGAGSGSGSRSGIRRVRYRENRSVLLSVSKDGRTLNAHACFRGAPPEIVDALVTVATSPRDTPARRAALRTVREWEGTRSGLERARRRKPRRGRRVNGRETVPLRAVFDRLNRERFGDRLPGIPLRISRRMTRSLGTVRYAGVHGADASGGTGRGSGQSASGVGTAPSAGRPHRAVEEIAISADLLRPANRALLEDTMLHEMAHAEAWLEHGHRGHGPVWRRIARRVGCRPRAVNDVRIAGR